MKALSHLKFDSLLDVGAAEGYKANIVSKLFVTKVQCCDLSEEACKRTEEIFNIRSTPADIYDLPFQNNEFDVVLCSETLEHVANLDKSIAELLRVANNAVIITVPHDPDEVIEKNIAEEIPHAHIHRFNLESFDFLKKEGYDVIPVKSVSPFLAIARILADATPREYHEKMRVPRLFIDLYNKCLPVLRILFGKKAVAFLIHLDAIVCKWTPSYHSVLFIITKNDKCCSKENKTRVSVSKIINIEVPYHYLNKSNQFTH
jgi:ubiquinone/menaquinone biosynthesis C-methylase UbiE